jgi:hypothetical protein
VRRAAALAIVALLATLPGCAKSERQKCEDAVVKEYMDADKVFQQPTDLDGFCAAWNDHPPGVTP